MHTKKNPKQNSEASRKLYFFEESVSKILCAFWLLQLKINLILHMTISCIFVIFFAPINE